MYINQEKQYIWLKSAQKVYEKICSCHFQKHPSSCQQPLFGAIKIKGFAVKEEVGGDGDEGRRKERWEKGMA